MGRVSSRKLQIINKTLRYKLKLKQWTKTEDALIWFKNIKDKNEKMLLQLDIESYYPSISEVLLDKAIHFASEYVEFDKETIHIIKHCRKTLLFNNCNPWVKKSENESLFDVAMGANDSAEICELVGLYILNLVKDKFQNYNLDFGLYRDDGLGCYKKYQDSVYQYLKKKCINYSSHWD